MLLVASSICLLACALAPPAALPARMPMLQLPPHAYARKTMPQSCETSATARSRPQTATQQRSVPFVSKARWARFLVMFTLAFMSHSRVCVAAGRSAIGAMRPWITPQNAMIPVVAGLLNWATNRLAVKMMFYPLRFQGIEIKRIGRLGWQGIVPGKARSMANSIVDDVMLRLIDVKTVFARLPPEEIATALEPLVTRVGEDVTRELAKRKGWETVGTTVVALPAFRQALRSQGKALVAQFVRDVQEDPVAVFDLREIVERGLSNDPSTLVNLFERCGEQDLRFVVKSGLWLGGALGIGQMLLWMAWSPWWSLAVTGAAVGMVTDQLALKLIFEPVEPMRLGPFTLQGLFLRRQPQVSAEFAQFMASNVLTAPRLWDELVSGSRSAAFWRLLSLRVDSALGVGGSWGVGVPNLLGSGLYQLLGQDDWEWLRKETIARLRTELPNSLHAVYDITDESLQLEATMVEQMGRLSSAEFERVLHPVFEEDEWTLILVGTALGGLAGLGQAAIG